MPPRSSHELTAGGVDGFEGTRMDQDGNWNKRARRQSSMHIGGVQVPIDVEVALPPSPLAWVATRLFSSSFPPRPVFRLEVGVAVKLVAQSAGVDRLVGSRSQPKGAVELVDEFRHALAGADDETAGGGRVRKPADRESGCWGPLSTTTNFLHGHSSAKSTETEQERWERGWGNGGHGTFRLAVVAEEGRVADDARRDAL